MTCSLSLLACIAAAGLAAEPPSAAAIQQATGIAAGLAVVAGSDDGRLEAELAATSTPKWRTRLYTPPAHYPAGQKSLRSDRTFERDVASRTPLNGGLLSEGGALKLRAPFLTKFGSSNSKVGYFERAREEGGQPSLHAIEIKIAEWNGKIVNPQELVPLARKK